MLVHAKISSIGGRFVLYIIFCNLWILNCVNPSTCIVSRILHILLVQQFRCSLCRLYDCCTQTLVWRSWLLHPVPHISYGNGSALNEIHLQRLAFVMCMQNRLNSLLLLLIHPSFFCFNLFSLLHQLCLSCGSQQMEFL